MERSMSRGVLPRIFRQEKTTEGISLQLRWDPKGPLDLPGFEEVLLAIHIGAAAKLTCRRGGRYFSGTAVHGDIEVRAGTTSMSPCTAVPLKYRPPRRQVSFAAAPIWMASNTSSKPGRSSGPFGSHRSWREIPSVVLSCRKILGNTPRDIDLSIWFEEKVTSTYAPCEL